MQNSKDKKNGTRTVFWWVVWITLTILAFFVAVLIWSPVIAGHFGSVRENKAATILWVTAVFGTWIIILVPLIVVMYQKVDKVYEDARMKREKNEQRFRAITINRDKRMLPKNVAQKLAGVSETIPGGHLVSLRLKDGRTVPHVFVAGAEEILGIYNASEMSFEAGDVAALDVDDLSQPPHFLTNQWLRLDGVETPA